MSIDEFKKEKAIERKQENDEFNFKKNIFLLNR